MHNPEANQPKPQVGRDRPLPPFQLSVQSSEMAVREALSGFIACLGPLQLEVEEIGTVELVLAEALNNIVEHAYPPDAPDRPINISCTHLSDGLRVIIRDHGNPMPDGQLPLGMAHDLDVDVMDMPEGGFGWFLIKDLAKDVSYHRDGAENRLNLRLAVAIRRDV